MKTYRAASRKSNVVRVVSILVFIAVILWAVCGIKANAAEKAENDKAAYQQSEREFLSELRAGMEEYGYFNAGITMTKVMDTDGSREYTVRIHHRDLEPDNYEKVAELEAFLTTLNLMGDKVSLKYSIV